MLPYQQIVVADAEQAGASTLCPVLEAANFVASVPPGPRRNFGRVHRWAVHKSRQTAQDSGLIVAAVARQEMHAWRVRACPPGEGEVSSASGAR